MITYILFQCSKDEKLHVEKLSHEPYFLSNAVKSVSSKSKTFLLSASKFPVIVCISVQPD